MWEIILMGFIAGLGTCLGALMVLLLGRIKYRTFSLLLGLATGFMLAVVFLDLLPAALCYGLWSQCLPGFIAGLVLMTGMDLIFYRYMPSGNQGIRYFSFGYFIAFGIAMHDLPEGLAIAAGFIEPVSLGPLLTLAIGLHNIPEGMATAAPLRAGGMNPLRVLGINALVSLVTPAGCLIGLVLINISALFLSVLMGFAAGAMMYIVVMKLLPESLRYSLLMAFTGLISGVIFVLLLNLFL